MFYCPKLFCAPRFRMQFIRLFCLLHVSSYFIVYFNFKFVPFETYCIVLCSALFGLVVVLVNRFFLLLFVLLKLLLGGFLCFRGGECIGSVLSKLLEVSMTVSRTSAWEPNTGKIGC